MSCFKLFLALLFTGVSLIGSAQVTKVKGKTDKSRPVKNDTILTNKSNPTVPTINASGQVVNQGVKDAALDQSAVIVSTPFQRTLHDNAVYIDERAWDQTTFDVIKKKNGDFALVYSAATENLDLRTKGIMFTLKSDFSQKGSALIITKNDEELRDLIAKELFDGTISISYTANDSKCLTSGGQRDNSITALKYTQVNPNGKVSNRVVDNTRGKIELKEMLSPTTSGDVTVMYNLNGKGKLSLATSDLNTYTVGSELRLLNSSEGMTGTQSGQQVVPVIRDVSYVKGKFLICTSSQLHAADWDLNVKGLLSGKKSMPVWPLLVVDGFCVADNQGTSCPYENYPYHVYTDQQLSLGDIRMTFLLNEKELAIVAQNGNTTHLHIFTDKLQRKHPPVELPVGIRISSLQVEEVDDKHLLLFYKTGEVNNKVAYRFTLYNWESNELLWTGEEQAWSEDDADWDNVTKIVRIDKARFAVLSFVDGTTNYRHDQTIEYRVVTVRMN